jgi:hypothetical protein
VSGVSEALALQELIGYTEGIVSALHVLGHAHRLRDDLHAARDHHRRALVLASQIGHAAAMCEAIEELARDEAVDRRISPPCCCTRREPSAPVGGSRCARRDAQQLADLERTLHPPSGATSVDRSFNDLVVEMTR